MTAFQLDVVLSPKEDLPALDSWLVIDVLRATTTLTTFLELGGLRVLPVAGVAEALAWRDKLGADWLTLGERGGLRVDGFDLGNSPLALRAEQVQAARGLIMTTSHGTAAIVKAAATGSPTFAAAARNATQALKAALTCGPRVGVLCAGRQGRAALDDTLAAGLIARAFRLMHPDVLLSDGARLALAALEQTHGFFLEGMLEAEHARFMQTLDLLDDIRYAAEQDHSHTVGRLVRADDLPGQPWVFITVCG